MGALSRLKAYQPQPAVADHTHSEPEKPVETAHKARAQHAPEAPPSADERGEREAPA